MLVWVFPPLWLKHGQKGLTLRGAFAHQFWGYCIQLQAPEEGREVFYIFSLLYRKKTIWGLKEHDNVYFRLVLSLFNIWQQMHMQSSEKPEKLFCYSKLIMFLSLNWSSKIKGVKGTSIYLVLNLISVFWERGSKLVCQSKSIRTETRL